MKNTILYSVQQLKPIFSWLSVGLFASTVTGSIAPPAKAQNYSDIQGHWAEQCIRGLNQQCPLISRFIDSVQNLLDQQVPVT